MPCTFISSWVDLKAPDFCRWSTIRAASLGPMPGRVESCSADAVLMLTFPVGAGLAARATPEDRLTARTAAKQATTRRCSFMAFSYSFLPGQLESGPVVLEKRNSGSGFEVRRGPPSLPRRPAPAVAHTTHLSGATPMPGDRQHTNFF